MTAGVLSAIDRSLGYEELLARSNRGASTRSTGFGGLLLSLGVAGAEGTSAQQEVGSPLENAVEDRFREISIVKNWPSEARGLLVVKSIGLRFR